MRTLTHSQLALALCGCLALVPSLARSQTAESTLNAFLTARVQTPTATGERSLAFRIGTKDLLEPLLAERGLSGRRIGLVTQRPLGDLEFQATLDFLVVDGERHSLAGLIRAPAAELPSSFFAHSRISSLRRGDSTELSFTDEVTEALQIGELETHGSELTLVGRARRGARLLTQRGEDIGYLFRSVRLAAVGGITDSFAWSGGYLGATAFVSGWLVRGPEKLVAEP